MAAKLRVLSNGKLYKRNDKLSLANCCCDPQPVTGCDSFSEINPAIVHPLGNRIQLYSGGPSLASFVKHVDMTITDDVTSCPFALPHGPSWGTYNQSPRSNNVPPYAVAFCNPTAYDSGDLSYGMGLAESYVPFCQRRFDIITGENIGGDDSDTEWYAEGAWEYNSSGGGPTWSVRWSESQGAAIYPAGGGFAWHPVDGELTILSLNPFHAIATLTPIKPPGYGGTLWYPSFLQQGTGGHPDEDICSPFTVEWTEV